MEKVLLIVNPISGRKLGRKMIDSVCGRLERDGALVTCAVTDSPGCAARLAAGAAYYDSVVCCGGDGTLHETLQGLMRCEKRPKLGYVPCGTTNDYASSLKLPRDPLLAAEGIAACRAESILDIGRFDDQFFSYVAAFGAFTECAYATSQSLKNALGYLAYLIEGSKDLFSLKRVPMKVNWGTGETEGEFIYGSVSNAMSIARVVRLRPGQAVLDDGMLELMLIRFPKSIDQLFQLFYMLGKNSFDGDLIRFEHVTSVSFESDSPVAWTLDGEFGAQTRQADICVEPGAVTLIH